MATTGDSGSGNNAKPTRESTEAVLDGLGLSRAAQERVLHALMTALEQELSQVERSDVEGYGAFEGVNITFTVKPPPQGEWEDKVAKATSIEGEVTGYMYGILNAWPKKYTGVGFEQEGDDSLTGV